MIQRPTTAVIGAGISGLAAGKNLGDYGIPYTCFEASDRVGGNWAFGNPNGHSSAYRSLHIDTSKDLLVQVADEDRGVPPASQMAAGERSRAEVRHYPCDHFDVHPGGEWFEPAVEHQLAFLRRQLGPRTGAR
jgi:cation diffusion facilitator CzcD-associated flavoprotein CzcO